MISFIHLSDIHFRKFSGDRYDVDDDLRNELKRDIQDNFLSLKQDVQGILICGDIAFSGKESEYKVASIFLNELCSILNIEESAVFCVPGNHDVDQDTPKNEVAVKLLQDDLAQQKDITSFDKRLSDIFRSGESSRLLYLPIETYNNKFAGQYKCNLSYDAFEWRNYISINEQYKLCLIGLNSTLISNADDHASSLSTERLMKLGSAQVPQREVGTIFLTLCHHPPECWNDPDGAIRSRVNNRVSVQLYGHKHLQTIINTETALIIGSGATHPSRWEPDWVPRYNWISLDIQLGEEYDFLIVRVFPRIYSDNKAQFIKDESLTSDEDFIEFRIKISEKKVRKARIENSDNAKIIPTEIDGVDGDEKVDWKKPFVYSFMNLSYIERCNVLEKLKLSREEDDGKRHVELITKIIRRAEEENCIDELIRETKIYKEKRCLYL